jgi:hypothetical protein
MTLIYGKDMLHGEVKSEIMWCLCIENGKTVFANWTQKKQVIAEQTFAIFAAQENRNVNLSCCDLLRR